MNAVKTILTIVCTALLLCQTSTVYAAEPAEQPQVPMLPVEAEVPPAPDEVCADWPYCVISLTPAQTQLRTGSATRFAR